MADELSPKRPLSEDSTTIQKKVKRQPHNILMLRPTCDQEVTRQSFLRISSHRQDMETGSLPNRVLMW